MTRHSISALRARAKRMANECVVGRARQLARAATTILDDALRAHGLTTSQVNLLSLILAMDEATSADLSRLLLMERSTVSRTVGGLRQMGLVEMGPEERGRRRILRLTPAGEACLSDLFDDWARANKTVSELLGDDGLALILAAPKRLHRK